MDGPESLPIKFYNYSTLYKIFFFQIFESSSQSRSPSRENDRKLLK